MKKMCMMLLAMALLLCACGARAQSYRLGDRADEIASIQRALTQLDLYYADVTGHFGQKTQTAVTLFQKKYGLAQTGVADADTIKRLFLLTDTPAADTGATAGVTTVLKYGSRSSAVRTLQENLTALGYYSGVITGHYGDLTQEAVRSFQRRNDLTADGIAGARTLGRIAELLGVETGAPVPGQAAGGEAAYGTTTLSLDMSGSAVRTLQENLTALGYYKSSVTGRYGRLTKEAVRRFQRDNGLTADGVAGPRTFAKMAEKLGTSSCESGTATTPVPSATPQPGTTPAAGYALTASLSTDRVLRRTGSSGYVTRLQNALGLLGFFTETPTGYFGEATETAVRAFQRAKGLTEDGVAGRATLTAINEALADVAAGGSID